MEVYSESQQRRFWSYVSKTEECWLWTAYVGSRDGFGYFNADGIPEQAHRISWRLAGEDLPRKGVKLRNLCLTKHCVRPDHWIRSDQMATMPGKRCTGCKQYKPRSEFRPNPAMLSRMDSWCLDCARVAHARWRERNPEKVRALKRRHGRAKRWRGLGPGNAARRFDRLFEEQDGLCAICRKRAAIEADHCHKTGTARGILCGFCNNALGWIEESPDRVDRALAYLALYAAN